jgi:hypothetical protein
MNFLRISQREFVIKASHREDFGHDYYFQILNFGKHWPQPFKHRSLLQFSLSWNDYASWPYIQITSGNGGLLGIIIWVYKFGFDLDFMSRTWNFKHLEELDNET